MIILKKVISLVLTFFVLLFSVVFCKISDASSNNIINDNIPVIIIDAGHGGEDGGAIADDGTLEKNLNLDISLKLNHIMSVFGYKTRQIRTIDTDLHETGDTIRQRKISDIRNRFAIMNEYEKCVYVSIHQNKFSDEKITGAQTFYSPNNEESKILAQFIQKSIAEQLQPNNDRVIKKSGTDIFLLYNATRPTTMVECGFISNKNELFNLKSTNYQTKMALSVAIGIINYNISEVK